MSEDMIEVVKLALFGLFENKDPNKAVMLYEIGHAVPKEVTDEEWQKACDDLEKQHFVKYEEFGGNPHRARFLRGPAYQKWRTQITAIPNNTTFNVSNNQFSGPAQIGNGNTQNLQINESDSKLLIELIQKIVSDPKAKEKASPVLEALKGGTIETAKEAVKQLLAAFLGIPLS